jgi:hypothetical protein
LICKLLALSIRKSGLTREQIAGDLSRLVGTRVTVSMLNDYSAASKKNTRFPLAFIHAFCEVTGDDRLQRFAAGTQLVKAADAFDAMSEALENGKRKPRKS